MIERRQHPTPRNVWAPVPSNGSKWMRRACALGWIVAWYGIYEAYQTREEPPTEMQVEYYHIKPGACTTDSDCMEKFGGSGGPEPRDKSDSYPICCSFPTKECPKCVEL